MNKIKIVEVGPRDGLQNEQTIINTHDKINFINQLSDTGLSHIEVSSFVRPALIPQLTDASEVFAGIHRNNTVKYSALVPNLAGLKNSLSAKPDSIAVFTSASETFCQKNINCSVTESLNRFTPVIDLAKQHNIPVRAYISCVMGCPYEGLIKPEQSAELARQLYEMGCYEISLGDTIGAGTPLQAKNLIEHTAKLLPLNNIAIHFHNTRGQALANILTCLELGVRIIDSSVAGLGGCPYAGDPSNNTTMGNVATEDVVYMLHGLKYQTGINLDKLIQVGQSISTLLNRNNNSHVGTAGLPYDYTNY